MLSRDELRTGMRLYAVTDNAWLGERSLASCVAEALAGGATFVQLRDKHASTKSLVSQAAELKVLCEKAGVPFVINDDVEAAHQAGADGVHVGQDDMACAKARALLGPQKIVGVSVQTVGEAQAAEAEGADYLGVGALFGTATKPDAVDVTFEELAAICRSVTIPVVAIGGLNAATIPELAGTGVDGAAVVSAIFAADDIQESTCRLRRIVDETLA